jgi:NAD(P)H-hydrate epimerase
MKVVTAAEMQAIDQRAMDEFSISGLSLMENAGAEAARAMESRYGSLTGRKILVLSGKGNNGGDGFCVARHLSERGADVYCILLASSSDMTGDARANLEIVRKLEISLVEITSGEKFGQLRNILGRVEIVVDALFGTGLHSELRGFFLEVIRTVNVSGKKVVAVDIPSGLDASTGKIWAGCIAADVTVTFGLPKVGQIISPHRERVGDLVVANIGFPRSLLEANTLKVSLLDDVIVGSFFPPRYLNSHKGTYGHVLAVAGSEGKTGAAILCARAALRAGAGLLTLAVPRSLNPIFEESLIEPMTIALPETEQRTISEKALPIIHKAAKGKKVVVMGPGLTTHASTKLIVDDLLKNLDIPMVVDADAINAVKLSNLEFTNAPVLATPHPGEMARLLDLSIQDIQDNRIEAVQKTARAYHTHILLKGDRTLISDPQGNTFINPTGNPGMATAGSGDVLSGLVAGFVSQGLSIIQAACAGAYIHGLAGDMAVRELGELSMIAGDILEKVPEAINQVLGAANRGREKFNPPDNP